MQWALSTKSDQNHCIVIYNDLEWFQTMAFMVMEIIQFVIRSLDYHTFKTWQPMSETSFLLRLSTQCDENFCHPANIWGEKKWNSCRGQISWSEKHEIEVNTSTVSDKWYH